MTPTRRGGDQDIPRPPDAEPGHPAPWATLAGDERRLDIPRLRHAFTGRVGAPSVIEETATARPSAVLACFWEHEGATEVLLTRRAPHLRAHKGEVSFPGGRCDPGETPVETALREAHEEVRLDPSSVEILGELDHLMTVTSRSFIVPLVAVLPGRPEGLVPNPAEVAAVRFEPVHELLADDAYHEEVWRFATAPPWASEEDIAFAAPVGGGVARRIFFFDVHGDTVWGATAAMLRQLLGLGLGIPLEIDHA